MVENKESLRVNHPYRSIDYWDKQKKKIWGLGILIRLLLIPIGLDTTDYYTYRVPVAKGLAKGGGLYNEVQYDQMPIYPYITAGMILIFGTESEILTAVAIKLPLAIADGFVPIVLYKIGIRLNIQREGLIASLVYAINPLTLRNVEEARWDGLMVLTVLIAFYFMLQNRPYQFGFMISLGFLIKIVPIYLFGIALVYWKYDWRKYLKSILTFLVTTISLIALILIPFNTSLIQMYQGLTTHPAYSLDETHAPIPDFIEYLNLFLNIRTTLWLSIWILVFFFLQAFSLMIYYFNPDEAIIIEIMTLQMTLLTIFFLNFHDQFLVWLFPWLLLWAIMKSGKTLYTPILITIGYYVFVLTPDISEPLGAIILGLTGIWIVYKLLKDLIEFHKNNPNVESNLKHII